MRIMARHVGMIAVAVLVVAVLLVSTVAFTVPSTEKVLIKTFGQTTHVFDGSKKEDAGLKFKWPYPVQKVVRYDVRTFILEGAQAEFQTSDKKLMQGMMYCAWRIADPVKFNRSVETVEAGERRLRDLLHDAWAKVRSNYNMRDYVNTEEKSMKLGDIERDVHNLIKTQANKEYGVEIAMVGIKSLGLPESVTKDVIEAMKKERQKEIQFYESSGKAQAMAIRERARAASQKILAFARTKASNIQAEGESAAAKYYVEFAKNEELSMFLRWLDSLKKTLNERTVMVLDPKILPPLGWFTDGPPSSLQEVPTEKRPPAETESYPAAVPE
jgi:membrane protease subunit HflC